MNRVTLPDPVPLGHDARQTAEFVAFLRDSATRMTTVDWHGASAEAVDTTVLHHLAPPTDLGPGSDEIVARWHARHRFGTCYYRRGPGFILVKDIRVAASAARYTLDDPVLVATFLHCQAPTSVASLTAGQREAIDLLEAERLLLRIDDVVVGLPVRMLAWPIPYTAI